MYLISNYFCFILLQTIFYIQLTFFLSINIVIPYKELFTYFRKLFLFDINKFVLLFA